MTTRVTGVVSSRGGLRAGRIVVTLLALAVLSAVVVAVALAVGSVPLVWRDVVEAPLSVSATIFWMARLPRVLLALIAGGALAVSGLAFQALLRNPLAEPYTLGVSSGASLGAMIAIKSGLVAFAVAGIGLVPLAAFGGALGTVWIVYRLARRGSVLPVSTLLLAGVTLSFFFGAIIMFVHFLADYGESYQFVRWMMGSLDVTGYEVLRSVAPLALAGLALLLYVARDLNLLVAGELFAQARGTDVVRVQRLAFLGASLATGSVIAATGPIGFVGLVVPHLLRLALGSDHRLLMPAAILFGGAFLVACDTLARVVMAPVEIPVGVVTAIVGGPFFMMLLRRQRDSVAFGGF